VALLVYSSEVGLSLEGLLPGIRDAAEWGIWLRPESGRFTEVEIARLGEAFGDLRGVVWHAEGGGAGSARVREYKRSLGNWPILAKSLVRKTTIQDEGTEVAHYSDVAWMSPGSHGDVANLLGRGSAELDTAVAFIPDATDAARAWASSVAGLDWLLLCRKWVIGSPRPLVDPNAVIRGYLSTTQEIGGVPGLIVVEHAAKKALVFLADRRILEPVGIRLQRHFQAMTDAEFEHWLRSPVYVATSP